MEFDDITRTESEQPAVYPPLPKPSPLPWILLFITVGVFVGTTLFLWKRTVDETERANQAYVERTKAEARATQAEGLLEGAKEHAVEMAADMKTLSDQKAALEEKLKTFEPKTPASKTPSKTPAKAPSKTPVKKTTTKKKKH